MTEYRVARQVLVYLHRRGERGREFLLLRRIPRHGGFWQGVSGAPDWGEPDDAAARREVREETGLDADVEPIDFRYELDRADSDPEFWDAIYGPGVEAVPEEVYAAEAPPGWNPTLAPNEHDAFRWCTLAEAMSLLRYENNRRALAAVDRSVRART